jgi:hypothetical protein
MADKQVDRPAPSTEVESLHRQIAQLKEALETCRLELHEVNLARRNQTVARNPEMNIAAEKLCDKLLSSTATEKTEAENG